MPLAQVIASNMMPLGFPASQPISGSSSHSIRGFHVPRQEQSNWCWAAEAKGVAARVGAVWQQCDIASLELAQNCCPTGSNPGPCDVTWYLDRALARVGHFGGMVAIAAAPAQIATEISAQRPIGVRVEWPGGGGHFLGIRGYANAGSVLFLQVEDPWFAASVVSYSALSAAYKGSGRWTHSYWTN